MVTFNNRFASADYSFAGTKYDITGGVKMDAAGEIKELNGMIKDKEGLMVGNVFANTMQGSLKVNISNVEPAALGEVSAEVSVCVEEIKAGF